jgi:predicted dehydrogenase
MSSLGIGIIGGGRICDAHALAARALPETHLAAVAEIDAERLGAVTARHGCRGYADYRELLADPEVEAVVVALPHWLHAEVAVTCLQAGRPVLVEKPLAMTTPECDRILSAAREAGRLVMVAHSQHYFPVNLAARQMIRDGAIGSLVLATDTWYKPFWEKGGQRPPWFLDDSKGGGMWAMNGSHMIDRLSFLLDSEVVAVRARIGNPIFGLSTDMGSAFLEFASGITATVAHAGYRDGVNRFHAEITGTEGQLKIDGDHGGGTQFWRSVAGEWQPVPVSAPALEFRSGADAPNPVFAAQMRDFALAARSGGEAPVSGEYGRYIVRVLEGCDESSRTGREVRL